MLNLREIDTTVGVYYLDWMDIRIGQWRHKLFSSRAWYLEIVVSSFALHLFCLYLWCFPLLRRCCSIPTNCRWFDVNGMEWTNVGSSSGRFSQTNLFSAHEFGCFGFQIPEASGCVDGDPLKWILCQKGNPGLSYFYLWNIM